MKDFSRITIARKAQHVRRIRFSALGERACHRRDRLQHPRIRAPPARDGRVNAPDDERRDEPCNCARNSPHGSHPQRAASFLTVVMLRIVAGPSAFSSAEPDTVDCEKFDLSSQYSSRPRTWKSSLAVRRLMT